MEIIFMQTMQFLIGTLGACVTGIGVLSFMNSRNKVASSKISNSLDEFQGKRGYRLSKKHMLAPWKLLEHLLYVGASGERKTAAGVLNNLLRNDLPPCSKVITDLKGEIYRKTHKYRESLGEENIIFEILGKGARYNPLDFCDEYDDVSDLAQTILTNAIGKSDFDKWTNMGLPLLRAMFLYVKTLPKQYANIPKAVNILTTKPIEKVIELLVESGDEAVIQQTNIFCSCLKAEPTRDSILINLLTRLQVFTDPRIVRTLSASDFSPMDLRKKKINLYVQYDLEKAIYLAPVLSIFNSQLIDKLMSWYDEDEEQNTVLFIWDEFQNVGKLPKLSNCITMFRSYKIAAIALVQNFSELYKIYGQLEAMTIISGFKTKCVFPSMSDEYATKYFSNPLLSGNTQVVITNDGRTNKTKKNIFDGDELRRLKRDHIVIVCANLPVIIAEQDIYFRELECLLNQGLTKEEAKQVIVKSKKRDNTKW